VVYASDVDKKKLTFQVSGMLWNRSLVMRDLETKSLWSHILGECMQGELEGTKLELIPSVMTTWRRWLADHPATTVLDLRPTADRFSKEFYKDPGQFVYGVKVAGKPQAYSFAYLKHNPVVQEEVGGVPIVVTFDATSTSAMIFNRGERRFKPALENGKLVEVGSGTSFDATSGLGSDGAQLEKLSGIVSYRRAWKVFYPESPVADPK
jgi:hypothetical protein